MDMPTILRPTPFEKLQALDLRAGKLLGNADFVHKQGESAWIYGFGLGFKIAMAGLAVSLLQCLLAFVAMFHDPMLNQIGAFAFALSLVLIADGVYPRDGGIALMPLAMTMAIAAFVGFIGGILGADPWAYFTLNIIPILGVPFGMLFAVMIMKFIVTAIAQAFDKPERPPLTMSVLRKEGLLTPDEDAQLKANKSRLMPYLVGIILTETWCCLAVLLILVDALAGLVLFAVGAAAFVASLTGMRRWCPPGQNLRAAILTRLVDEGYVRQVNIPAHPKPFVGYELQTERGRTLYARSELLERR